MKTFLLLALLAGFLVCAAKGSDLPDPGADAAPSAESYYNAAIASEKAGDAVAAIGDLQRALLLDPGLSPARDALARVATAHGVSLPPPAWSSVVNAFSHPDTRVVAGAVLAWLGVLGFLSAARMPRRRLAANGLAALAVAAGAAGLISGWLGDPRMTNKAPALVTARDGAELLTAPSNNSTPVTALPPGAMVDVLSPRGAWSYVELHGSVRGWVQTERLEPLIPGARL